MDMESHMDMEEEVDWEALLLRAEWRDLKLEAIRNAAAHFNGRLAGPDVNIPGLELVHEVMASIVEGS